MISFPNAKINLGLNVVARRSDGYHDIETIFYPINWRDALEINDADKFDLEIKGIEINGDIESNLITKAYRAVAKNHSIQPIKATLLKNIPMGGGLGGGSSDAAFMVKMLNDYNHLGLSQCQMEDYVKPIGADCAFFIANQPTYAFGKGDEFDSIELDLSDFKWVVINPLIHVDTRAAYQYLEPKKPAMNVRDVVQLPINEWKDYLINDFESSVFKQFKQIEKLKNELYENGAIYASMSGSGASVYGIFPKENTIDFKSKFPNYAVYSA